MKRWFQAFIFALLSLIFYFLALYSPWYTQTIEMQDDYSGDDVEIRLHLYLEKYEVETTVDGSTTRTSKDYSDIESDFDSNNSVFFINSLIVIMIIIGTTIFLILIFFAAMKWGKGANICQILGLIIIIFSLLSPISFAMGVPNTFKNWDIFSDENGDDPGYTESFSGDDGTISWGPARGWYLIILAFILMLSSLILIGIAQSKDRAEKENMYISFNNKDSNPEEINSESLNNSAKHVVPENLNLECPGCKKTHHVEITRRPAKVVCTHCGKDGNIS
jgi:hypothetical protein